MFSIVLILVLVSFITIVTAGTLIGTYGSAIIGVLNISIALTMSICLLNCLIGVEATTNLGEFIKINDFSVVNMSLQYDTLAAVMFVVVTSISTAVHVYSTVYMYSDPGLSRFIAYLSFFTFCMLLLVSANNFLVLFMGWEGVGFCSYLLISFGYTRAQAAKAATKAFIVNKVGDVFLLTAIVLVLICFGTVDFSTISVLSSYIKLPYFELIAMLLLFGVVGKSAQIGLHTGLPDAMEGPTPVSALLHAATMVTAGVFLLLRASAIIDVSPQVLVLVAEWGALTAFISGLIGAAQNDIKKIIAYSTCSQLGYMVLICGASYYNLSLFHLFNHAFFKALLFLAAGSIIHLLSGEQDIRRMGSIGSLVPVVYVSMLLSSIALMSFPFTSGFYSKDLIIEVVGLTQYINYTVVYWLAISAAVCTAFYSAKLCFNTFIAVFSGGKRILVSAHRPAVLEYVIFTVLVLCSVVGGYFFRDFFIGAGISNSFSLAYASNEGLYNVEFYSGSAKLIPLYGSVIAALIFGKLFNFTDKLNGFESGKMYYNEVVNAYISLPILKSGRHLFEQWEYLVLKGYGPDIFIRLLRLSIYRNTTNEYKKG